MARESVSDCVCAQHIVSADILAFDVVNVLFVIDSPIDEATWLELELRWPPSALLRRNWIFFDLHICLSTLKTWIEDISITTFMLLLPCLCKRSIFVVDIDFKIGWHCLQKVKREVQMGEKGVE